ncbi:MAG: hypothetical protein WEE89_02215 [Gemmatimonadota bacterium]
MIQIDGLAKLFPVINDSANLMKLNHMLGHNILSALVMDGIDPALPGGVVKTWTATSGNSGESVAVKARRLSVSTAALSFYVSAMVPKLQLIKRFLASLAAGLVVGTSLLTPLLDREQPASLAIEAQHDAQRCAPLHDHGVCVQLQHARALPQLAEVALPQVRTSAEQRPFAQGDFLGSFTSGRRQARAPPIA